MPIDAPKTTVDTLLKSDKSALDTGRLTYTNYGKIPLKGDPPIFAVTITDVGSGTATPSISPSGGDQSGGRVQTSTKTKVTLTCVPETVITCPALDGDSDVWPLIHQGDSRTWKWQLEPVAAGPAHLYVNVTAYGDQTGMPVPDTPPPFPVSITVTAPAPSPPPSFWEQVGNVLSSPLAVALYGLLALITAIITLILPLFKRGAKDA